MPIVLLLAGLGGGAWLVHEIRGLGRDAMGTAKSVPFLVGALVAIIVLRYSGRLR